MIVVKGMSEKDVLQWSQDSALKRIKLIAERGQ